MPTETRDLIQIPFHDDTLYAIRDENVHRVAIKDISDRLGLDWSAQRKRINRNPILSTAMAVMAIQMPDDDQSRDFVTLPMQMLNGWLFGIQADRVNPEIREVVLTYQRECYDVLFQHFYAKHTGRVGGPMTREEIRAIIRQETDAALKAFIPLMGHVVKGIANKRVSATEQTFKSGLDDIKSKVGEAVVRWMSVPELLDREGLLGHRANGALSRTLHYRLRQFANRRDRAKERAVQEGEDVYTVGLIADYLDLGGGGALLNTIRGKRRVEAVKNGTDLFN